jgi:hypothetical protein
MSDKLPADDAENENGEDTLIVPPPGFRERLLAAQKARTSEIRQSVEIPNPMKKADEGTPVPEQPAQQPASQPVLLPASQPALQTASKPGSKPAAASVGESAPVGKRKSQPSMELTLPKSEDNLSNLSSASAKADETSAQS